MEVRRVSDTEMVVVFVLEDMLRLICVYALKSGKRFEEKKLFMS